MKIIGSKMGERKKRSRVLDVNGGVKDVNDRMGDVEEENRLEKIVP